MPHARAALALALLVAACVAAFSAPSPLAAAPLPQQTGRELCELIRFPNRPGDRLEPIDLDRSGTSAAAVCAAEFPEGGVLFVARYATAGAALRDYAEFLTDSPEFRPLPGYGETAIEVIDPFDDEATYRVLFVRNCFMGAAAAAGFRADRPPQPPDAIRALAMQLDQRLRTAPGCPTTAPAATTPAVGAATSSTAAATAAGGATAGPTRTATPAGASGASGATGAATPAAPAAATSVPAVGGSQAVSVQSTGMSTALIVGIGALAGVLLVALGGVGAWLIFRRPAAAAPAAVMAAAAPPPSLPAPAAVQAGPPLPAPAGGGFCANCGAPRHPQNRFCASCGRPFDAPSA